MDTELRCYLCETPGPPWHCDICNKSLCKTCWEKHLSDESKKHIVVPIGKRGSNYICQNHLSNVCELYCEECEIPICALCVSSREHQTHKLESIWESLKSKKNVVQKDLKDLEDSLFPKYQKVLNNIPYQKDGLNKNSHLLKLAIKKYGDDLHKEVDNIIQKLEYDLDEMNSKQLAALEKQETEIEHTISKLTQCINDLKMLLNSYDVGLVFSYKTRNYLRFPPKVEDFFPRFTPPEINKGDLYKYFGSPSVLSIRAEDQIECDSFESFENVAKSFQTKAETEEVYTMDYPGTWSSPQNRQLIGAPQIISEINTDHKLRSVSYLSDGNIWTSGLDNILRLYDLKGVLLTSVKTKPMNTPWDIAVKKNGDLIYTDYKNKTVNIVINTHIKGNANIRELITLKEWEPLHVCSTSSDDILVVMLSKIDNQTKVVRYSGSLTKQTIQYRDKNKKTPLYSSGHENKYISENRNLDICVSDYSACAVVVVNKAGNFRYIYTGFPSTAKESLNFYPYGITTDSQSRILTADPNNRCIHILDQDGQFLRCIDNCHLQYPFSLCVDTRDNLFVTEHKTGTVKKIQYLASGCIQNMLTN